jgi:hypothetical protein
VRGVGETVMSLAAVGGLILAVITVDRRVGDHFSIAFASPLELMARAGSHLRGLTAVALEVAQQQSMENAALVIFMLAATVLVMFMLRS